MGTTFEEGVMPHLAEIRAYCFYLASSKWDGEDLYQDVILKTYHYYERRGPIKSTRAFLYKVAKNLWVDKYRRRHGYVMVPMNDDTCSFYYDTDTGSIRVLMEWLADRLSKREFQMFMLSEMFEYSDQEIAVLLDCTVPAVKCVLHRTRQHLLVTANRNKRCKKQKYLLAHEELDHWIHAVAYHDPQRVIAQELLGS